MRRYVVPSVDPEDQDLADLFCQRANSTSDPDNMQIDRRRWGLAREIARRMGIYPDKENSHDGTSRVIRHGIDSMDYRRCTIAVETKCSKRLLTDQVDADLSEQARHKLLAHMHHVNRWLARSVLARVQGIDYLPCSQIFTWIDGNERNCRRENLRMVDGKENPQISENPLASPE